MSLYCFGKVWQHFPNGGGDLICMLALADWAGDDGGRIYPSVEMLAAKMRMSERQTRRILRGLIDNGWIIPTSEQTGGRGNVTHYRMNMETLTKCPKLLKKTRTPATVNPDKSGTKGGHENAGAQAVTPNTAGTVRTVNNRYTSQPVDNSTKTDLDTLKSYLRTLEGVAQKDAGTHEEINRVNEQIKQMVINAGTPGPLEL